MPTALCLFLLPYRRCKFLKPAGSSSCPLLLFDPFACSCQLLSFSGLARCISLAGNSSKAAVQQLMSQGVLHAQRTAAAGAFAALPLKQKIGLAAEQQQQEQPIVCGEGIMGVQQQQQQQQPDAMLGTVSSIDLQGVHDQQLQQVSTQQHDKLTATNAAEVVNITVNCAAAAECAATGFSVCAARSS
jgi:hypothetical protein